MSFKTIYDIPEEVLSRSQSPAFAQFLHHWFVDTTGLTRREVDLTFLRDLTEEEREIAKDLLRRNLRLNYTHIIQGVAALNDVAAVPVLRGMLAEENDLSRKLIIAGTLWRLVGNPVFVDCLNRMKVNDRGALRAAHFDQVLWLDDERAIDLLIDLLDDSDSFVRFLALSTLNRIEFERVFRSKKELPRSPEDYRPRRNDPAFRMLMVKHLQAYNAAVKTPS
jgi:hypothetical protein